MMTADGRKKAASRKIGSSMAPPDTAAIALWANADSGTASAKPPFNWISFRFLLAPLLSPSRTWDRPAKKALRPRRRAPFQDKVAAEEWAKR